MRVYTSCTYLKPIPPLFASVSIIINLESKQFLDIFATSQKRLRTPLEDPHSILWTFQSFKKNFRPSLSILLELGTSDDLRDLVAFVRFKKREKKPHGRVLLLVKLRASARLHKWYKIAQSVLYFLFPIT